MREQHLELFPLAARGLVRLGLGDTACGVACAFVDRAQNFAAGALGQQRGFSGQGPQSCVLAR
jgi:hypothetical protein